jgi:hypothetical protein
MLVSGLNIGGNADVAASGLSKHPSSSQSQSQGSSLDGSTGSNSTAMATAPAPSSLAPEAAAEMLVDYVCGRLGGPEDWALASQITR